MSKTLGPSWLLTIRAFESIIVVWFEQQSLGMDGEGGRVIYMWITLWITFETGLVTQTPVNQA